MSSSIGAFLIVAVVGAFDSRALYTNLIISFLGDCTSLFVLRDWCNNVELVAFLRFTPFISIETQSSICPITVTALCSSLSSVKSC